MHHLVGLGQQIVFLMIAKLPWVHVKPLFPNRCNIWVVVFNQTLPILTHKGFHSLESLLVVRGNKLSLSDICIILCFYLIRAQSIHTPPTQMLNFQHRCGDTSSSFVVLSINEFLTVQNSSASMKITQKQLSAQPGEGLIFHLNVVLFIKFGCCSKRII